MENLKKGEGYSGNNRNRPGWKYQIDATKPDVYLMSDNLKCFIGRPVVYFVFDVSNRINCLQYLTLSLVVLIKAFTTPKYEGPSRLTCIPTTISESSLLEGSYRTSF